MVSNLQRLLYNKFTDVEIIVFVRNHIINNCYGNSNLNEYHTFKRNKDEKQLIEFMLYLYVERHSLDIKPTLKTLLTENTYKHINVGYRRVKKKYNDLRPKTTKRPNKIQP